MLLYAPPCTWPLSAHCCIMSLWCIFIYVLALLCSLSRLNTLHFWSWLCRMHVITQARIVCMELPRPTCHIQFKTTPIKQHLHHLDSWQNCSWLARWHTFLRSQVPVSGYISICTRPWTICTWTFSAFSCTIWTLLSVTHSVVSFWTTQQLHWGSISLVHTQFHWLCPHVV